MIMTSDDIGRAGSLLAEVEKKMGMVFKGMGRSDIASLINDAVVFVANSRIPEIPIWQFAKHFEGDMDKMVMDKVLMTLEAMNLVEVIKRPGTDAIIHIKPH
jgi:hypothetical protein